MKRNYDNLATSPKPALVCVRCGQPLASYWQPSILPTKPGHWLTECRDDNCALYYQTFSTSHYPPSDLEVYLKKVQTT